MIATRQSSPCTSVLWADVADELCVLVRIYSVRTSTFFAMRRSRYETLSTQLSSIAAIELNFYFVKFADGELADDPPLPCALTTA